MADLTYPEAAAELRISVPTLKRLVKARKIAHNRPTPRRVTFSQHQIEDYRRKVEQKARR